MPCITRCKDCLYYAGPNSPESIHAAGPFGAGICMYLPPVTPKHMYLAQYPCVTPDMGCAQGKGKENDRPRTP